MAQHDDNPIVFPSTQLDPWRIIPRSPEGGGSVQSSRATKQPPVYIEDVKFRSRFDALEKRVEAIQDHIATNPVTINTLGNDNWELRRPLNVTVEQRAEDEFIACLYDADLYGYGDSIPGALEDLKAIIVDQFAFLLEHERTVELGSLPKGQLEILRRMLVKVDA